MHSRNKERRGAEPGGDAKACPRCWNGSMRRAEGGQGDTALFQCIDCFHVEGECNACGGSLAMTFVGAGYVQEFGAGILQRYQGVCRNEGCKKKGKPLPPVAVERVRVSYQ